MALLTPATHSIINNLDGSNRTGAQLSTMIVVRVGIQPVGAIQSIDIHEARQVKQIDELGTDGHIDSSPVQSTNITGSCKRIRYDRLRISEAFSRGFLHTKSQRIGFDIDIYDKWNGDGDGIIVTTLKNVWITNIGYTYSATEFLITDDMSWEAEDISSSIQGGSNAATGGALGLIRQTDSDGIEQQTDRGLRRGSLDAPNLINAVFSGF